MKTSSLPGLVATLLATVWALAVGATLVRAADHADAPFTSNDASADLNDSFIFLDPNDNNFIVISMTVRGFIVPGEAGLCGNGGGDEGGVGREALDRVG